MANLSRVQAQDRLHQQLFEPTDHEGIHQLYLEAYGDEELARQARLSALKALVRRDTEAARMSQQK